MTPTKEIAKSKAYTTKETIAYIPHSVAIKTILNKPTGNVSVISFDTGEELTERINPFDIFIQIIEGNADVVINGNSHSLPVGQSIVVPAHQPHLIRTNGRFKMIQIVIKSAYI